MSEVPDDVILPCGCQIKCMEVEGVNTMVLVACRPGCEYVAYALQQAEELGKDAEVREI